MSEEALIVFRQCRSLLQIFSDPARQDIILLLAQHERLSVNEITSHLSLSRPAISHHLKMLRDNRLVNIEQKGTQRFYTLSLTESIHQLKNLLNIVEKECT
ncbi:metalloregulator ArsR/SmtB family transcription factor [Bacillus spongiae]|uniref:Metalloregulator ArsR/SmtB family transcription factor n=1 Tax=Bacillus spongiae TaxID=2683610 RepID=A0ABU8HHR4_9BACI